MAAAQTLATGTAAAAASGCPAIRRVAERLTTAKRPGRKDWGRTWLFSLSGQAHHDGRGGRRYRRPPPLSPLREASPVRCCQIIPRWLKTLKVPIHLGVPPIHRPL